MRFQSKSTLSYIMRNFWKLVYVALPVSVLMAFFVNPTREIEFLHKMVTGQLTLDNVFVLFNNAYTVLRFGKMWWVDLIVFVLLALTVAMLIVKINRHMRIGVMPALPFKKTFRLFPVTLGALVCFFCLNEIAMLLSVGVMYILRASNNVIILSVVGVSIAIVVKLLMTWAFMLLILALPLKYSENYRINVGLSYSVRVMTKMPRTVWGVALICTFGQYVLMLCAYFARPYYLDIVLYFITYLFLILLAPAFAYKVYYDVVGGGRRDIYQTIFD